MPKSVSRSDEPDSGEWTRASVVIHVGQTLGRGDWAGCLRLFRVVGAPRSDRSTFWENGRFVEAA